MSNKVIKSVSFNVTVKEDEAMLKHVKRRNFSGYVKKLIMQDMALKTQVAELVVQEEPATLKQLSNREKLDQLKQSGHKPAPPKLTIPQRKD